MPVEFLSDVQVVGYGRFVGVPSSGELERFFFLDDVDRALVGRHRGAHSRLGFAVQLMTVRFLGVFLEDPVDVPWPVVEFLAGQLGIGDASVVKRYTERPKTAYEHAWEIRDAFGFRSFDDVLAAGEFATFLAARAWTHVEGPGALFDAGVVWLREHLVLLPGITTLTRLVAGAREAAADRTYRLLSDVAAASGLGDRLVGSLSVTEAARVSVLERWRRPSLRVSGPGMVAALGRADELCRLGVRDLDCSGVPANRMAALARYGMTSKAPALADLAEPRRTATLLALTRYLDAAAVDDVLDLFMLVMATRLISPARRAAVDAGSRVLPRLAAASRTLVMVQRELFRVLDDATATGEMVEVAAVWAAVEQIAPRDRIAAAVAVVDGLVPDEDVSIDATVRTLIAARYRVVRPFLIGLCELTALDAAPAGELVLAAVRSLPGLAARKVSVKALDVNDIDGGVVPTMWRRAVFHNPALPAGAVDRDAYVMCVLEQLQRALQVRDVYAAASLRWSDPRAGLLAGAEWAELRPIVLASLGLGGDDTHLDTVVADLDAVWQRTASAFTAAGETSKIQIVIAPSGRARLSIERLGALEIPASLDWLHDTTASMLPRVDLPELLLEVHAWTGFLDAYVHVSGADARLKDLAVSVAALLTAEACNVGLVPVTDPEIEALTRGRLSHVDQNYVRGDTHTAANARLIASQADIPLARQWGGGLLASVDGLRFVVPVQSISTAPSPKYFGHRRGVTWLNALNDQVAGIGARVVAGTPADSLHILDVLLNLDGGPKPDLIATDQAAYSDIVFGLFRILGYRFSPRLADLGDTRLWRATPAGTPDADYGPLNPIARNKIQLTKIIDMWHDMIRVAGSLVTHRVRAYDIVRLLGRNGHPTPLGQAFAEYGRIAKTVHVLAMCDPIDDTHRRTVNTRTTVQESRHRLARKVFHGQHGRLHQKYREGQEDQLGALGIVLNAIVLWNTRYLDHILDTLRTASVEIDPVDIARLSPLGHAHINELGRYHFPLTATSGLRPLRPQPLGVSDRPSHQHNDPAPTTENASHFPSHNQRHITLCC